MIPHINPITDALLLPVPATDNPLPIPFSILNEEREAPPLKDRASKKSRTQDDIKFPLQNFHGHGTLKMENGDIYEGELKDGIPHGKGKITYSASSKLLTFEGEFSGIGTGHGIARFKDSGRFTGTIRKGLFDGIGTLKTSDGAVYSGQFKNHQKNGKGILLIKGNEYDGIFKDDQFIQGTLIYSADHPYLSAEGEFLDHSLSNGTLIYKNGEVYKGTLLNSLYHGKGTRQLPNGTLFNCEFKDGKMMSGTASFPDGRKYAGEFNNDAMEGSGTMTYLNRMVYTGEFKNNLRHGKGTLSGPAGWFNGLWMNDKMCFSN